MRQFNEISALWRSVSFSKNFFQDVALNWRGIGTRYLMLILLLTWAVVITKVTVGFTHYINTEAAADLKDFPTMTMKAGKLSSPVEQPYDFKIKGKTLFVLDTTGETKRPQDRGTDMLLTETQLVQHQASGDRSNPWSAMPFLDGTIDQAKALDWLRTGRNLIPTVFLPAAWAFALAYRIICALIYGAIALGFASAMNAKISYAGCMRLAMMTMTPILYLDTIFTLISVDIGCFTFILYPAITLGYLAFAVKCVADANRPSSTAFPVELNPTPYSPTDPLSPFP
jgi:hypothetical protein